MVLGAGLLSGDDFEQVAFVEVALQDAVAIRTSVNTNTRATFFTYLVQHVHAL